MQNRELITNEDLDEVILKKEFVEVWVNGAIAEKAVLIESYTNEAIKVSDGYYLRANCTIIKPGKKKVLSMFEGR
ncbi:hypothetical protein OMP38_03100 [Cohnella ginsengisoli]|uniref:Uncharacterized protein n=1 Tax=Cohnella ginsengisoli TaxID=425004 RepID=A0A9X4QKY9_9BACL|nr:hypothetical protein [Cohnella ginsengisoli]MDG0789950.1 hypothetical protein [Cohnella ginsengisoli]